MVRKFMMIRVISSNHTVHSCYDAFEIGFHNYTYGIIGVCLCENLNVYGNATDSSNVLAYSESKLQIYD